MAVMTGSGRGLSVLFSLALGLGLANCGDDTSSCQGGERCACYPNATCDDGLSCLSNICVDEGSSANGGAGDSPSGGGGGDAGKTPGSGLEGGAPPSTNGGGSAGPPDGESGNGGSGQTCRTFDTYPDGTVPTVFVLVDRSGSMFHCLSTTSATRCDDPQDTAWAALKTGTLEMIDALESSVRFGFGAFAGERTETCPDFHKVPAKLDNYPAIAEVYDSIPPPTKGETPTATVLAQVQDILEVDPSPGRKYVLLVTDGEPDFCDDGDPVCPVDATVGALQALQAAGIETLIFGVDSVLSTVSDGTLYAFANAGAGEPVAPPVVSAPGVQAQCQSSSGWQAAYTASGATGTSIGSYSSNGSAPVFRPDPTDQQALRKLFQGTVAGIKSCVFDLAAGLQVNLSKLAEAQVVIEGRSIARDDDDGWRMNDATQLELVGDACDLWREPDNRSIDFRFPCGVVIDE
jgi:hypothetical protein